MHQSGSHRFLSEALEQYRERFGWDQACLSRSERRHPEPGCAASEPKPSALQHAHSKLALRFLRFPKFCSCQTFALVWQPSNFVLQIDTSATKNVRKKRVRTIVHNVVCWPGGRFKAPLRLFRNDSTSKSARRPRSFCFLLTAVTVPAAGM